MFENRNNMFELADRLVGIYKTHDATKSVTINPKMFEQGQVVAKTQLAAAAAASESEDIPVSVVDPFSKPIKRVLADSTNRRI